jgi:hypothetical protein
VYDVVVSLTTGKVLTSLLVVDFDADVDDKSVEIKSFVISTEDRVNIDVSVVTSVVSDRIDDNVDIGFKISIVDVIRFEVSS